MADWCASTASTRILYLCEEVVLRKKHVLNQSIAALRRFVGLLGRFVTVWKKSKPDTQTHPTTVTLRRMRAEG